MANNEKKKRLQLRTCGVIVRGSESALAELIDHIRRTEALFLIYHRTRPMKIRLVEEAF
ncbi:MAG: hypothetical protein ACE5KV_04275 [Thermoplasmata archaeon]